jgi:TolB-like protein/DNA-binding winged helix-turn-helix (wHTH) protein
MNAEYLHGFYLGDLLVEPLKRRVTGKNGSQHLPPKAAEVLVCLAQRAGAVVDHDVLLEEVWGKGQGTREALSHAVSEIRQALDDHHDHPAYIQTLPKRGYRLVMEPVLADAHTGSVVIGADGGATIADLGLVENLKRRGVLETAIAYAVLGWLIIQVVDIVFANLGLPNWVGTFVTVLVIAGFPIALILSWFLEIRDGNATLDDRSPLDVRRRRFSRTYVSVVGALGAAAVIVFVYDRYIGLPDAAQEPPAIEIPGPVIADNSIAVLPFLNNDGSEETRVFANGLVDDVITRLSRVPGLLVTSRGDSFTLEPNSASDRVRQRLEVAMYLEGSVEIRDDQIRVIVQLIDSTSGFHIQSRSFDRARRDFFEIRDEITELTVSSLRTSLPNLTRTIESSDIEDPGLNVYLVYRRGVEDLYKPRTMETTGTALAWFDAALQT